MKSDAFLFYDVGEWAQFGLAVPNWSDDIKSQNETIRHLTEVTGRNLQAIMFHPDANLRVPPSVNTLTRIHKLVTRARSILAARAVPSGQLKMEPHHAIPAPEVFHVFPTPYFKVRNQWLKQYCGLVLTALTEAFQHTENAVPLEISESFAGLFGQYLQRVYQLMAVELLQIPKSEAEKPDFTITDAQLAAYNPSAWFTSTEMIDTVPPVDLRPTEDALAVLTNGIPVTQLPELSGYPTGDLSGATGVSTSTANNASFAPAPGA